MSKLAGQQFTEAKQLLAQLSSTDPGVVRNAALELGDRRGYRAVPAMLEILGATSDGNVPNGVA